jgi:predicted dehydrogenase
MGIWGLGRGLNFFKTCSALNIDVVAGCDFNSHMRERFKQSQPDAFVTADADEFLKQDFDAVLLATYCPAHADDAIRCLNAGKHVLSEVTAFHTMAEGVRLTEAVLRTGKIYQLAENYPFSPAGRYLARKWQEGLFGELMYAEFEYVHECRWLVYTYIDGVPVQPGWTVHNWRSWLNFHYYCTHSLGPAMVITGTRPVQVQALPSTQTLPGYMMKAGEGMGGVAPSLIRMSNGGLVRNLMGATTNDTHVQRLWGTRGSAEINCGKGLQLRLGAAGSAPKFEVKPALDKLGALAASTGHGGGDFWVLYYFARQILTGAPGPFDIFGACDVTIPGILAYRSSREGGKPYDVPDFRRQSDRDAWRNDHWDQKRYDVKRGCFPADADKAITGKFSTVMADLCRHAPVYRAYADWGTVRGDLVDPAQYLAVVTRMADLADKMIENYRQARTIADAYPRSDGARVLREMLEVGGEAAMIKPGFKATVRRQAAALARRFPSVPPGSSDRTKTRH